MEPSVLNELKNLFDRTAQPWVETSEELLSRLVPTRRYLGPRYWLDQIARRTSTPHAS